ncbi:MAG: glycosyltransferase, partial [Actinomycetes bacterium]
YPERERLLKRVAADFDLGIWGGDWKRRVWRARFYQRRTTLDRCAIGAAGPSAANLIYGGCAVNLNLHGPWDGLNMRVFEIPGAGGFQLCDARDGLSNMFDPGSEIEVFESDDDMLAKIEHALGETKWREGIAAAGRRRAHAEHTLGHRMQALLARLAADLRGAST